MAHTLASARLTLSPAEPHDLPALFGLRAEPTPLDRARQSRIRELVRINPQRFAEHHFGVWMIRDVAGTVGFVGLRPRESALEPELYYGLTPAARSQGYATEAARVVIARLFESPAVTGVWAVTGPDNLPSCRVLERLGMRLEFVGVFDQLPSRLYRLKRVPSGDSHR